MNQYRLAGKKLLILGANPETAGLVLAANSLGIYTIVTDYKQGSYAKRYAWRQFDVDAADPDAVEKLARTEQVDGVLVGVAEALIPVYHEVCRRLGMPCYASKEQFDILTSKDQFKQLCKQYDIPVVYEYNIDEKQNISYPVVIKPVDSSSSKGISICRDEVEYIAGIKKALENSKSKRLLIEKYMTGEEVVIYYSIQDGNSVLTAMCDRYTNKEQEGVAQLPVAYIYPSRYLKRYMCTTDEKVQAMFRGLGLKNGSMFIQSFIEEGEVRFYEPGYRLNGAQEQVIVSRLSGIDAQKMLIHFALTGNYGPENIKLLARPNISKFACKLSPLVRPGKISKITGLEEISKMDEVIDIKPSYDPGDTVDGLGTLRQIICRFYIITDTIEHMTVVINKVYDLLQVKDDMDQNMMLTPFNTSLLGVYKTDV